MASGIEISNLSVAYRRNINALDRVTLHIPFGSIAALVGVNGSGKSTLFKTLVGILKPKTGDISIQDMPISAALKKNMIAYVPQNEDVDWAFPVLVYDVVMMGRYGDLGMRRSPRPFDHEKVMAALARVGMATLHKRQIGELSGGQRKRVFLARALAQDAKIILLDEPFTGVDVTTEDAIILLLKELRAEGRLMLVSTHNLGSVPEFCDRTIFIKTTVLAEGPTAQVFTRENLESTFGGVLRHFVLGGGALHEDEDKRQVTVISDEERPFVIYDDQKE